jgi:hypothetical protein
MERVYRTPREQLEGEELSNLLEADPVFARLVRWFNEEALHSALEPVRKLGFPGGFVAVFGVLAPALMVPPAGGLLPGQHGEAVRSVADEASPGATPAPRDELAGGARDATVLRRGAVA